MRTYRIKISRIIELKGNSEEDVIKIIQEDDDATAIEDIQEINHEMYR